MVYVPKLWDGTNEWKVGVLSDRDRRLPLREVINDTLLKDRILKGWRPEMDMTVVSHRAGSDVSLPEFREEL